KRRPGALRARVHVRSHSDAAAGRDQPGGRRERGADGGGRAARHRSSRRRRHRRRRGRRGRARGRRSRGAPARAGRRGGGAGVAALCGAAGAIGGVKAGEKLEETTRTGVPKDELYLYEDALAHGRGVLFVEPRTEEEERTARAVLLSSGAESLEAAREAWWVG